MLQILDWLGGTGTKPTIGQYLSSGGLVSNIANADNVRGTQGIQGVQGEKGLQGAKKLILKLFVMVFEIGLQMIFLRGLAKMQGYCAY